MFKRLIEVLKLIQCAINAKTPAKCPLFMIVRGSMNRHMANIEAKRPEQLLAMLRAYGDVLRDLSRTIRKSRNIYSKIFYFAGTQLVYGCDVIEEHLANPQAAENIVTVLLRTIGHQLVSDEFHYRCFGKEWDEDKEFLRSLGHLLLKKMELKCGT